MMNKNVGFITEKAKISLIPEDQMLQKILKSHGVTVYPIAWDEFNAATFEKLHMAVFRTPWNYYLHIGDFLKWLETTEKLRIPLHNPASVVRWNLDKHYLRELEARGAPVVPTQFFKTEDFKFDNPWIESPTSQYVLKPVISASANRTFRGDRLYLTDIITEENVFKPSESLMLQPFVESVLTEGEFSFLFFNGEYSHTIVKKPKAGDFRVQNEHGGSWDLVEPSPSFLYSAQQVLKAMGTNLLYARIDMVLWGGQLHLMECELFEPMIYIKTEEHANNFARALMSRL